MSPTTTKRFSQKSSKNETYSEYYNSNFTEEHASTASVQVESSTKLSYETNDIKAFFTPIDKVSSDILDYYDECGQVTLEAEITKPSITSITAHQQIVPQSSSEHRIKTISLVPSVETNQFSTESLTTSALNAAMSLATIQQQTILTQGKTSEAEFNGSLVTEVQKDILVNSTDTYDELEENVSSHIHLNYKQRTTFSLVTGDTNKETLQSTTSQPQTISMQNRTLFDTESLSTISFITEIMKTPPVNTRANDGQWDTNTSSYIGLSKKQYLNIPQTTDTFVADITKKEITAYPTIHLVFPQSTAENSRDTELFASSAQTTILDFTQENAEEISATPSFSFSLDHIGCFNTQQTDNTITENTKSKPMIHSIKQHQTTSLQTAAGTDNESDVSTVKDIQSSVMINRIETATTPIITRQHRVFIQDVTSVVQETDTVSKLFTTLPCEEMLRICGKGILHDLSQVISYLLQKLQAFCLF